ncbi:MAG: DUF3313 family protein [Phenylobacterium sp.]
MERREFLFVGAAAVSLAAVSNASAATPEPTWDGLVLAKSKRLDLVYLQPGADFRGYTKVMLDPTEVAFEKDWRRDYNRTTRGPSARISEQELQEAISKGMAAANDIFAAAASAGGYAIVQDPAADVLRLRTAVLDIDVAAPDQMTAGRSRTYARETGAATLVVEARDSLTGALLGRAIDRRIAGNNLVEWKTSATNRGDFRQLVKKWADISISGLNELKALSPISEQGGTAAPS